MMEFLRLLESMISPIGVGDNNETSALPVKYQQPSAFDNNNRCAIKNQRYMGNLGSKYGSYQGLCNRDKGNKNHSVTKPQIHLMSRLKSVREQALWSPIIHIRQSARPKLKKKVTFCDEHINVRSEWPKMPWLIEHYKMR